MLSSGFSVQQTLLRLRAPLVAVAMLVGGDAGASVRDFNVGFSSLSTADPMGGQIQYALWYPTDVPNGTVKVGPFEFPGTRDAAPAVGTFGLVILSHGSGGSPIGHWDTAVALVRAGFIAAGPLHPRNNIRDDIGDRRIVLDGRPLQLSAVIDALLAHESWSRRIERKKIGAFGFSAGGYTVLAALGAARVYARTLDHCERHAAEDPYCRIVNGPGHADRVREYAAPAQRSHDDRLCAGVIADLYATPFSDAGLKAMPPVKLLFFRPEVEDVLKAEFHVSRVVRLLKQRDDFPDPEEIVVQGARHMSFLAPYPESVGRSLAGPEGFDRAAFAEEMTRRTAMHEDMNRRIVSFFRQAFADCAGG